MSLRQDLAMNVSPIFIRVALGVTFLWAGLSKFLAVDFEVNETNAPALVRSGILNEAEARERDLLPPGFRKNADAPQDADPEDGEDPESGGWPEGRDGASANPNPALPRIVLASQDENAEEQGEDASDTGPYMKNRVYGLALGIYNAANPGTFTQEEADQSDEDNITDEMVGEPKMRLLPKALGENNIPSHMAHAAAITEIVAGAFCLLGLLTRLSALSLAGVMGMAMWLTQIGPAMQMQTAQYGFLPGHNVFDISAWATFGWQLALLCAACALFFSGPGTLSIDRLFGGGSKGDDAEG